MPDTSVQCYVYRSARRADTYLFVADKAQIDELPAELLKLFGRPEFSFEFTLTPQRELVNARAEDVLRALHEQGFYLQLPPENTASLVS